MLHKNGRIFTGEPGVFKLVPKLLLGNAWMGRFSFPSTSK